MIGYAPLAENLREAILEYSPSDRQSKPLGRMWAIAYGTESLADLHAEAQFYEEVRTWMAKYDAEERKANGEPIPEEIVRTLRGAIAEATTAGDITDIYRIAGIPLPDLRKLNAEAFQAAAKSDNVHLAIEALRDMLIEESTRVTSNKMSCAARRSARGSMT